MHKLECVRESLYRPQGCVCEAPPLSTQAPPHPILPWTRQAVQSTTELAVSVCSLFIFKLISVAIGTSVNLKNFFFFCKVLLKGSDIALTWKNVYIYIKKKTKVFCK